MRGVKGYLGKLFTVGTVPCAILCGIVGLLTAILLLWGGIWKVLLVAFVVLLAVFIGGVREKRAFIEKIFGAFGRNKSQGDA